MLDSQVLQAPLLDHRELDLDAARRVTYIIEQRFRYDYDAPVKSLRQRLVVIPPTRHTLGWMKSIPPASSSSRNWASVYRLSPAATGMPMDARRSA